MIVSPSVMVLFLIFCVPVSYIVFLSSTELGTSGRKALFFGGGTLATLPMLAFYWTFVPRVSLSLTPWQGYVYHFVHGYGGLALIAFYLTHFLWKRRMWETERLADFLAGFYTALCLKDAILYRSWYGEKELFVTPLLLVGLLVVHVALLSCEGKGEERWRLWLGTLPPLIAPVVLLTFTYKYSLIGWLLTLVFLSCSAGLHLSFRHSASPLR